MHVCHGIPFAEAWRYLRFLLHELRLSSLIFGQARKNKQMMKMEKLRRFALVSAICFVVVECNQKLDRDDPAVVGARITTCSGCRLNSLHEVRTFIREEMRTYPAISIAYVPGRDPIIEFLNKYNRVVKKTELAPLDRRAIHQLVQDNGIHHWTQAPKFELFPFQPTDACFAWRQTAGCDPKGLHEEAFDESCDDEIDVGRSGYCECSGGRPNVQFDCTHKPFKCHDVCLDSKIEYIQTEEL